MNKRIAVISVILVLVFSFGFAQTLVSADDDNDPYTPGYWKSHPTAWVEYSPDQTIASIFPKADNYPDIEGLTLIDALDFGGGKGSEGAAKNLLRAAVAALLNAADPDVDYPLESGQIMASVNSIINPGDRDEVISLAEELDAFNNG